MIVSNKYEFIFVHIPRTAGTRISKSLCKAMGIEGWRQYIGEPKAVAQRYEVLREGYAESKYAGTKHIKARELKPIVGREKWKSYFKFAFVRNPWDRAVSTYMHRRKVAPTPIKWLWPKSRYLFRFALKAKYSLPGTYSSQQVDYLTDERGDPMVDFVGRFERLQEDFKAVCNEIGVEADLGGRYDPTNRDEYKKYYDKNSKKIIKKVKNKDVKKLEYCF